MRRKVALITGAATGIGKRTAMELAQENYNIAITYVHSRKESEDLVELLEQEYGIEACCFKSDASIEKDCLEAVRAIEERFGGVDIFIHNAGPYIHERKPMADYSAEEFRYMLDGNLSSFFYLSKSILPYMRAQKWGRIITFGFERCETAPAWQDRSIFAAAKSGLTSLTRTLAKEEATHGITVNMVCPGDITSEWKEAELQAAENIADSGTPVGRPGTGGDISRVIAFLCKEESGFITGSVIPVTGGKEVLAKSMHKNGSM